MKTKSVLFIFFILLSISQVNGQYSMLKRAETDSIGNGFISLAHDDNYLYGATTFGAKSNYGCLYRIKPDGSEFKKLVDFNDLHVAAPYFLSTYENIVFGVNANGVFRINKDGSDFRIILSLDSRTADNDKPYEPITISNRKIYGSISAGGYRGLYKMNLDGTGFKKLSGWETKVEVGNVSGKFTVVDNHIFGVTHNSSIMGTPPRGTVFKIDTNGTGYIMLHDLYNTNGSLPNPSLTYHNGALYGTTDQGGRYKRGTLFRVSVDGEYETLVDFTEQNREMDFGSLEILNNKLYGLTRAGCIYEFNTDEKKIFQLWDLDNNFDKPEIVLAENHLFGMMKYAGIFKIDISDSISNIALNKKVTQSSTQYGGLPERAVDGNTDGIYSHGSVTHTGKDLEAWLEIDLGGMYDISSITLWNRTDVNDPTIKKRLSQFYLLISDVPFASKRIKQTLNQPGIWKKYYADYPDPSFTCDVGRTGRYVRIQSQYITELSIAEVEVMGTLNKTFPVLTNVALNKETSQSSTEYGGVPRRAIDGNTNGKFSNGSVTLTEWQRNAWWEVDLGNVYDISSVELWCRTDEIPRFAYALIISETPFVSNRIEENLNQPGIWKTTRSQNELYQAHYPSCSGRYVRVQLLYVGPLSLAEVVVMGSLKKLEQTSVSNFALNKPATQSSTWYGGIARRAVDGNTSGIWSEGSVTHTGPDKNPWWEVDLCDKYYITDIEIWNRTDRDFSEPWVGKSNLSDAYVWSYGLMKRLSDFYVIVSDEPFGSEDLTQTLNQQGIWQTFNKTFPVPSITVPVKRTGRYVRIQCLYQTELSLAEVVVHGSYGLPPETKSTMNSELSIAEQKSDMPLKEKMVVFPIPFSTSITVVNDEPIDNIEIYNMTGRLIYNQNFHDERVNINTLSFSPGIYIIKVRANNQVKLQNIVKEK